MSARMDRLEFYRADDDFVYDERGLEVVEFKANHRWRLVAAENGRTIAASTEAYRRRIDAVRNAARVLGVRLGSLRYAVKAFDMTLTPVYVTHRGGALVVAVDVPLYVSVAQEFEVIQP